MYFRCRDRCALYIFFLLCGWQIEANPVQASLRFLHAKHRKYYLIMLLEKLFSTLNGGVRVY